MNTQQRTPLATSSDRHGEIDLLSLVRHAGDAQRVERLALGLGPVNEPAPSSPATLSLSSMLRRAALPLSAAAAIAGVLVYMGVRPVAPRVIPAETRPQQPTREIARAQTPVGTSGEAATTRQPAPVSVRTRAEAIEPDLSALAALDPGAMQGLPSLSQERRLVIAVPVRTISEARDCAEWNVLDDDADAGQMLAGLRGEAVACAPDAADDVLLVQVQGPRHLLPFHEDDARALAQCLAEAVPVTGHAGSCEDWAGSCVPTGLSVSLY